MVPSGPSTPIGGAQSVPPSLLRSNSGMLAAQGGPMPSQSAFPPLMSPRTQYNTMNLLGNVPNVSSLLSQSLVNGVPSSGLSGQRGGIEPGAEPDPLANGGNGMGFNPSSSSFVPPNMANPNSSNQLQGQHFSNPSSNQILPDQQQLEPQSFQHGQQSLQQLPTSQSSQPQQQQQYQSLRGGFGSVKLEPQVANDHQHGSQQLPSLRNINPVKLEPQQIQSSRNMVPVKMEPQHSDQTSFQQQQQQQFIHMPRQSSQAATAAQINLLHQHRLLQIQQHQQQQLLKAIPQQRSLLPQQFQHAALRSPVKPVFEPGMCARRLTHYMYHQRRREDNSIEFWRKFVGEYFAPNAKKKWCVSMYGSGRQTTTGVFPEDVWHCEICNRKPGRGFEATVEVLPRLFKIKYESGTLEELLYVDMPREYPNASGQYVLDYAKAIQESVFDQLRVVREGRLRIVFSPDLKICSWEFCAWRHEELIPRRLLMPQVSQIAATAKKCHTATQIASSGLSAPELQNNCNMFVASARQLTKALEVPLVNDLGYTKRYVRCLQISEVVNSMKDLIDFSRDMEIGPVESLNKYPRRTGSFQNRSQQPEERHLQIQQHHLSHHNTDQNSIQGTIQGITSTSGITSVNNSSASTSTSTIASLLHHHNSNSMNPRQLPNNGTHSPYNGTAIQIPSPGSSSTVQPNPSPFHSPTPSSNNLASPHNMLTPGAPHMSGVANPQPNNDGIDPGGESSQNSVQKMIHDLMVSSHANGVMENGVGAAGSVAGQPMMMMNGNRGMNWRMGMVSREQNQASDLSNQLLGGLGSVNCFNNLQFDWKSSP